jgi:hypothetical protein
VLLIAASGLTVCAGYGDKVNGFPNWQERVILTLTDACRMAPLQYRNMYIGSSYSILLANDYPAVPPVYWNLALNESARFHAIEMADTCGLTHNSCNGDAFNTRIQFFYANKSSTLGEDIASGYSDPVATMSQWLLDEQNGVVPADLSMCGASRCDGHRWNIMNKSYKEMGAGYAYGPQQYNYFWCQDLAGGKPESNCPIVSAVHVFPSTGTTSFLANYYDTLGKPENGSLYINDQKTVISLMLGTDSAGTYGVSVTKTNACRSYYFVFTDAKGVAWRYPATGDLVTSGEGNCVRDFTPVESLSVNSRPRTFVPSGRRTVATLQGNRVVLDCYGLSGVPASTSILDTRGRLYGIIRWNASDVSFSTRAGIKAVSEIATNLPVGVAVLKHRYAGGDCEIEPILRQPGM